MITKWLSYKVTAGKSVHVTKLLTASQVPYVNGGSLPTPALLKPLRHAIHGPPALPIQAPPAVLTAQPAAPPSPPASPSPAVAPRQLPPQRPRLLLAPCPAPSSPPQRHRLCRPLLAGPIISPAPERPPPRPATRPVVDLIVVAPKVLPLLKPPAEAVCVGLVPEQVVPAGTAQGTAWHAARHGAAMKRGCKGKQGNQARRRCHVARQPVVTRVMRVLLTALSLPFLGPVTSPKKGKEAHAFAKAPW